MKNVVYWYVTLWCSGMEIYRSYEVLAEGYVCMFHGTLNVGNHVSPKRR